MQTPHKKIIQELGNLVKTHTSSGIAHKLSYTMKRWELELVTDWIISDRKRICGPLIKVTKEISEQAKEIKLDKAALKWAEAIDETLNIAQLDGE